MSKPRPTLSEMIHDLGKVTPLAEVFILNAIDAFANSVVEEPKRPDSWGEHDLINWDAWYDTAKSLKGAIDYQREQG